MGCLLQGIGTGLVILAIADIYLAVLYPRSDKGIISVPLARGLWHFFRFSAKTSHYYQAVEHLAAQGIAIVANLEAGADLYVSLRRRWNPNIIALAKHMEYDWSAIAPSVVQGVD